MKLHIVAFLVALHCVVGPPVDPKKKAKDGVDSNSVGDDDTPQIAPEALEYSRYLQEVVQILEQDPDFRKKLETANVDDIKSGKIAKELELVDHKVRTSLDELKRQEMERLRHLAIQEYELNKGLDKRRLKIPGHLDHKNPHSFEIEDLRKLIVKTTKDLDDIERRRKDEFKEYEMQKEYERLQSLKEMDEDHKKQAEKVHDDQEKKHKDHPQLHHPGSKQQLEQVWEEQDHMSPEDFNPKTFFYMHDLDGNGVWDANEVKALFKKELDKMYDPNAPEDDMRERQEEMERMREHVFNETDTNKDKLISFDEFMEQTRKSEFEQDQGWDTIDQQDVYSQQEFDAYQQRQMAEMQRMIDQGMIPPHPGYGPPPVVVPAHGAPLDARGYQQQAYQQVHPSQGYPHPAAQAQMHARQPGYANVPQHPAAMQQQAYGQYQGQNVQHPPQQHNVNPEQGQVQYQQGQFHQQPPPQQPNINAGQGQVQPQQGQIHQQPPQQQHNVNPPAQGNEIPAQIHQQASSQNPVPVQGQQQAPVASHTP